MTTQAFLSISGKNQGLISAGCCSVASLGVNQQVAHIDKIMVHAFSMTKIEESSGNADDGPHRVVTITKNIDKSSPLLPFALCEEEELDCTLFVYRTLTENSQEKIMEIRFTAAKIISIDLDASLGTMEDAQIHEKIAFKHRNSDLHLIHGETSA